MNWVDIAARVKQFRTLRGWTQPELAEAIGRHRATVARIESGDPCQPNLLYLVAKALEIDVEKLTGEPDPLKAPIVIPVSTGSGKTQSMLALYQPPPAAVLEAATLLCAAIERWESLPDPTLPLGEVMKVTVLAHQLREILRAVAPEG